MRSPNPSCRRTRERAIESVQTWMLSAGRRTARTGSGAPFLAVAP